MAVALAAVALPGAAIAKTAIPNPAKDSFFQIVRQGQLGQFDNQSSPGPLTVDTSLAIYQTDFIDPPSPVAVQASVFGLPSTFDAQGFHRSGIFATYNYSYVITAPDLAAANRFRLDRPVVTASGQYALQSSGYAFAEVAFSDLNNAFFGATCGYDALEGCTDGAQYSTEIGYFRFDDLRFYGQLRIVASANLFGSENSFFEEASAFAFIDPVITIDEDFLASNPGFSVTQIFNPAPNGVIPEPGTWAMLIVGFAMVGIRTRRRSNQPA